MHAPTSLTELDSLDLDPQTLLSIQREKLLPLLQQPTLLNQYAQSVVEQQIGLIVPIHAQLTQQLGQCIQAIIAHLGRSEKSLKTRRFNALQKWLGTDIEFDAGQINYMSQLDQLIDQASHLCQRLELDIEKTKQQLQRLEPLRIEMAHYVHAAQQFLTDYPKFVSNNDPLDHFPQRLSKKINSLITLQSSHDQGILQMRLSQQLAMGLIDRFREAQQVLIPAWRFHVQQSNAQQSQQNLQQLDQSRDQLIQTLKRTLEK